jgi:hypothetical protein
MLAALRTAATPVLGCSQNAASARTSAKNCSPISAMLTDENLRRGMAPDEASRQAHLALGNIAQLKEIQHDRQGLPQLETLFHDIRYALHTLRRSPGFTLVAVLTLALGIGVNTTLFTAFDAIVLKPLPVKAPGSVIRIERWFESRSQGKVSNLLQFHVPVPLVSSCESLFLRLLSQT